MALPRFWLCARETVRRVVRGGHEIVFGINL